jgi:transposase
MIALGSNVRIYLAAGRTDMRCGIGGLCALARNGLALEPSDTRVVVVFRGRKGDRIKLLHWDGQGFCLYYKILERGHFPWPNASAGTATLTAAQMSMLWEGIDWRQPQWTSAPLRA